MRGGISGALLKNPLHDSDGTQKAVCPIPPRRKAVFHPLYRRTARIYTGIRCVNTYVASHNAVRDQKRFSRSPLNYPQTPPVWYQTKAPLAHLAKTHLPALQTSPPSQTPPEKPNVGSRGARGEKRASNAACSVSNRRSVRPRRKNASFIPLAPARFAKTFGKAKLWV